MVVTTAEGAEYGFGGWMGNWQAYLTSALPLRGREVRAASVGIAVMTPATPADD